MGIKEKNRKRYITKFTNFVYEYEIFVSDLIEHKGINLYIVGLLQSNKNILGLQICDLVNKDNLLYVFKMTEHFGNTVTQYSADNDKLYEVGIKHTPSRLDSKRYLYESLICLIDDRAIDMFNNVVTECYNTPDPKTYLIAQFQRINEDNMDDLNIIHSIMTLQRFLNHCIQTQCKFSNPKSKKLNNKFIHILLEKNQFKYLPKIAKCWNIQCDASKFSKRIQYYKPNLNINLYLATFLDNS